MDRALEEEVEFESCPGGWEAREFFSGDGIGVFGKHNKKKEIFDDVRMGFKSRSPKMNESGNMVWWY